MRRAAIYIHYKPADQGPEDVEHQRCSCQEYATSHGFSVTNSNIYSEAGLSGPLTGAVRKYPRKDGPLYRAIYDDLRIIHQELWEKVQKRLVKRHVLTKYNLGGEAT